jgi:hypothetical protein
MTNDKELEAVARAICKADMVMPDELSMASGKPRWTQYTRQAKAALAAIPPVNQEVESNGQFLKRVGMDGWLWSEEMHKMFPAIPQDDLLGWCCNMIMAGYDEAERRFKTQPPSVNQEMLEALKFYADDSNYRSKHGDELDRQILEDWGAKAKQAILSAESGKGEV